MLEQGVMHLPELALRACCFCRLSCGLGVLVNLDQRKMAVRKAHGGVELLLECFDDGMGRAAVRTLEVAVLQQCYGGVTGPLNVISRSDLQTKNGVLRHLFFHSVAPRT